MAAVSKGFQKDPPRIFLYFQQNFTNNKMSRNVFLFQDEVTVGAAAMANSCCSTLPECHIYV